jgi:hypothetical protein
MTDAKQGYVDDEVPSGIALPELRRSTPIPTQDHPNDIHHLSTPSRNKNDNARRTRGISVEPAEVPFLLESLEEGVLE